MKVTRRTKEQMKNEVREHLNYLKFGKLYDWNDYEKETPGEIREKLWKLYAVPVDYSYEVMGELEEEYKKLTADDWKKYIAEYSK